MERKSKPSSSADRISEHMKKKSVRKKPYDGDTDNIVSTGSTLLDLAIAGTRIRGGGLPTGIACEIAGDSSAGKTVLMCEIAGAIQRKGGDVLFNDPEARLDKEFAKLFDMTITEKTIKQPDTIAEVFEAFEKWKPVGKAPHGIFADSIAALCTEAEMKDTKGYDGAKRANDFSQGFRRCTRMIEQQNYLMVFSNQLRDVMDAGSFGPKTKTTGGHAPKYYASVRLKIKLKQRVKDERTVQGKLHKQVARTHCQVDVDKSSVDHAYRSADLFIDSRYGIDDVRANLQFLKTNSKDTKYWTGDSSMTDAINSIEEDNEEGELREAVINLWEEIQEAFKVDRKPKQRF